MRAIVIINPMSGPRPSAASSVARARLAERVLRARGVEPDVHVTEYAGHACVIAARAAHARPDVVIAWGGDGTVREVAEGLVGRNVAFAIVPAGSGNGLAREIGVPRDPERALVRAVEAPSRVIDAGRIGGRVFVNVAGLGVDARVAARFNAQRATGRGVITYALATLAELRRNDPVRGTLRADGAEPLALDAAVVAIANSGQYGNGARIAPGAALDDGRLDVVVVGAAGLASTLWRARRLYTGSVLRDPTVVHRRIARATIACAGPILFHVDGDAAQGGAELEVEVLAGALRIKA